MTRTRADAPLACWNMVGMSLRSWAVLACDSLELLSTSGDLDLMLGPGRPRRSYNSYIGVLGDRGRSKLFLKSLDDVGRILMVLLSFRIGVGGRSSGALERAQEQLEVLWRKIVDVEVDLDGRWSRARALRGSGSWRNGG